MDAVLQSRVGYVPICRKHLGILYSELIRNTVQTLEDDVHLLILTDETWELRGEMLHQATQQQLITSLHLIEIEQLANHLDAVLTLQGGDDICRRCHHIFIETVDGTVADDRRTREGLTEHHSLQRLATAQCHVGLTMRKGMGGIDDGVLKGQALALVDGYRPSQAHRILAEHTFHCLLYLLRYLIESIFRVGPLRLFEHKFLIGILAPYGYLIADDGPHLAYHTIIEAVLRIVLDKHHLCARFQCELIIGRISRLWEIILHLCRKRIGLRWQGIQLLFVDVVGRGIVGGQADIFVVLRRNEVGDVSLVECLQRGIRRLVLPYLIEERDKAVVLLAIHRLEFDGEIMRLLQCLARKEKRRVVILAQHLFVLSCQDWSQLMQVAYHQELHTAKGKVVLAITAHHGIDGIEQVTAHHTDLVDDQQVHRTDDVSLHLAELIALLFASAKGCAWEIR